MILILLLYGIYLFIEYVEATDRQGFWTKGKTGDAYEYYRYKYRSEAQQILDFFPCLYKAIISRVKRIYKK